MTDQIDTASKIIHSEMVIDRAMKFTVGDTHIELPFSVIVNAAHEIQCHYNRQLGAINLQVDCKFNLSDLQVD